MIIEGDEAPGFTLQADDAREVSYRLDDKPLEPEHRGPLNLVVPKKYAYKSAKWIRKLRFTTKQERGYWEKRGYSNTADPWKEERYARADL